MAIQVDKVIKGGINVSNVYCRIARGGWDRDAYIYYVSHYKSKADANNGSQVICDDKAFNFEFTDNTVGRVDLYTHLKTQDGYTDGTDV